MTSLVKVTVWQLWSIAFSVPSQLTAAIGIDKQLTSYTSRCRSASRSLYFINYCYIISELRAKLKVTSYLTTVDTLKNNG